jgi:glutaredoxin-like protein
VASEAITFYWRPGCGFCMRLDRGLSRLGVTVDKQNIWDDPDAAAFVRSVANGNETVPTVVVGDQAMVNPSLDLVVAALHEFAPHLIPDEPPERDGLVSRIFGG